MASSVLKGGRGEKGGREKRSEGDRIVKADREYGEHECEEEKNEVGETKGEDKYESECECE